MTSTDWLAVAGIGGWLVFVAILVVWSLLRRPPDPQVRQWRLGIFVERDRKGERRPDVEEDTKEWPPHT
jgi:hypothetical protein